MNKRLLSLLLLVLVVMMPVNLWAQDEGGTTLKSNVYVGGDISMLPKYEEAEVEYKDSLGNTVNDVIAFFKQEGLNAMRVRLFVDPTKATDNEQKQGVCQDLNYVIALGKRIKDAGLSFLLDFHYSDTWADPGRQWTPDAWKTLDDDALAIQLYTYTKECLQQLKNAGAIPDMIQTGNEISYGMLWGVSGTTDNRCYTNSDNANWLRFFNLLGQTTKACREECPNAKIILHNERVNNISTLTDFYDRMQSANIDYDIIGLSYYPEFHGNLATLEEAISALEAKNYGKSIMLVETGYSYAWSITDGVKYDYTSTYPFTEEGQRQFTADLITMLNQHSSITGLFWWWPEDNGNKMVTSYWWNAGLYNHETGQPYAAFYELKNFVGNSPGFEPYAVLTTDTTSVLSSDSTGVTYGKTLTFYYDDQKEVRNGMSVGPFSYGQAGQAWYDSSGSITKAVFDASFANCTSLTSTAWWFYQCRKLSQIEGIENLKTDNVTNMVDMFCNCSCLTNLDVSNFKTDNVTNMSDMFYGCSGLTNLDVSGFKTDNVTDMSGMFSSCSGLTSLDVSNFKTDNVTNMSSMFSGCTGLTNLDVSNFNTSKITSMFTMFYGCSGLTSLDLSSFNTGNVTSMQSMFLGCTGLTSLDVSNFNTENVTNMSWMFNKCSSLTSLDLSSFNTSNVKYEFDTNNYINYSFGIQSMFEGCSALTTIWVGDNWTTANLTESVDVFKDCAALVGGAGTHFDPNHVDYTYAHIDGGTSNPGYFTDKNASLTTEPYVVLTTDTTSVLSSDSTGVTYGKTLTFYYDDQKAERNGMNIGPFESSSERGWNSNADSITVVVFDDSFANCTTLTSTALWFSGCRNLKTIVGIENLKTDHVTTMFAMFDCCNSLTSLDVSKFNTENVTRMNDMFSDCRSLTSLDVTNFNTAKVTDMCDMFINCSSLTSLDVSNFKTDSVTNMSFMFIECSGLTSLDLSNFNTAKVTDMSKMFALCSGLKTIYVGEEWTTASVTDGTDMFKGCSAIKGGKGTTYSETFTIAYGNSTSSDYARIDYKGMPGYFTPKYGYTPEPTYTLEGNVLTIKAPIESSVYYVITDLYSGIDFESGDSLRIPETLYTGPLTLDHPVRVRFMAVNGRIAHSEIIVVKYKPIEATFDGRVLAVGGSTTMTDALESVGGRDEVAKTITAIVWNSTATLSNSDLQGLDNPNLLIYVNERSLAPENRNNVVVNGLAMNVVLSDTGSGNCDFYAPQTFTAEMITYSREFKQATQVGVCRGWETISLPFMVQTIAHADQGVITPFGIDTSNKHFWLRQLSTNGLVSATKIEANQPYLISMPNDEKNYAKEYILKGLVTFSAENAVVPKTEPTVLALADSSVVMMPALQSVGKSSTVWALNVGMERSQYFEGSTFERDYREVRPFEAYTIHRSDTPAPRFLPINDLMNSTTGIETISNVIMSHDNYYHIDGRKVDGKPTKKGLYITNGRKVVIK